MQNLLHPETLGGLALLAAIAFALSAGITYAAIRIARRYHLHAMPNERSSHTVPTPQVGGIGVALPVIAFMALNIDDDPYLLTIALAFFAIGLYDDFAEFSPLMKLPLQIMAIAVPSIVFLNGNDIMHTPIGPTVVALLVAIVTLWIVGFVNVFNFMDGMNGYAGSFAIVSLAAMTFLTIHEVEVDDIAIIFALIGSTLGFMLFNCKTNATVFLGDSGSHFLGFLLAYFALQIISTIDPGRALLVMLILLMPFLYDATYTLVRRLLARKPFWKAHREHLYQRLMITGMTHMQVLRLCVIIHLLCAGLAIIVGMSDATWIALTAFVLALVLMIAYTTYVIRVERSSRGQQAAAPPELQS